MALSDAAVGAQGAIQQIMARRFMEQKMAEQQQQQAFENDRQSRRDAITEDQIGYGRERDAMGDARQAGLDANTANAQMATQANTLADQVPPGFLEDSDPAVSIMQRGGRAGLLTRQDARPEVASGPLLPGDTGAAKAQGFLKTASAAQQNTLADNERAAGVAAESARRSLEQQSETGRHNRAMEGATAQNRNTSNELNDLKIQAERDKQDQARAGRTRTEDSARESTASALELANRLETHPGMGAATGAYEMRGSTQPAVDFNSIRDQLVATLTLPNLGALKGPMSDKDILFVKQLATRLQNTNISEPETRRAIAEAKTFLQSKSEARPAGGSGGGAKAGDVKTFPNGRKAIHDGQGWVAQ